MTNELLPILRWVAANCGEFEAFMASVDVRPADEHGVFRVSLHLDVPASAIASSLHLVKDARVPVIEEDAVQDVPLRIPTKPMVVPAAVNEHVAGDTYMPRVVKVQRKAVTAMPMNEKEIKSQLEADED